MATSPSHQLGEWIGDFFERSIINYLQPIIIKKGFYLDYRHPRAAREYKKEVIGIDKEGNKHKLDIVIEKNGSENTFGIPKAYIEMAWRRYVKHSKNKVPNTIILRRITVIFCIQSPPFSRLFIKFLICSEYIILDIFSILSLNIDSIGAKEKIIITGIVTDVAVI